LAHHVTVGSGKRRLMVASLRYLDTFVKIDGAWLFAERLLYVDWLEERALSCTFRRCLKRSQGLVGLAGPRLELGLSFHLPR
jgi:hypothetical protein